MRITISILFFTFLTLRIYAQYQSDELDVQSYHFKLEISDTTDLIYGSASIELILLKPTSSFSVDLNKKQGEKGMEIEGVFVNGLPSCYHFGEDNKLHVKNNTTNWPDNKPLVLRIDYAGIPDDGLIISDNKFGTRSFFADNWPNRAHHWIPVVDHPSDKATVSFQITAPSHYQVIASGKLVETETNAGKTTHRFETRLVFPTKVMVFAASHFKITQYDSIYGIPVSSWIFSENQTGEMDYQFATEALQFFSDTIGPYLYSKLANVQSKTRFGGMENAGNIFYFEQSVNGRGQLEAMIAHEVAHHWFGNVATEKDWPHIWLSEGFANYLTDLYIENKYGREAFLQRLKQERKTVLQFGEKQSAKVVDSDVSDLMYLLNPNSYQKGAWVLHILRQKVGDEAFYRILQRYYDRFKYSNAATGDFINVAEEVSGLSLDSFFNQWLYYPVNPKLEIDYFHQNDTLYIEIEQEQKEYLFDFDLEIKVDQICYSLPVSKHRQWYAIPIKKLNGIEWDPNVALLYSARVNQKSQGSKIRLNSTYRLAPGICSESKVPFISLAQRDRLQPGDLLFQDLDCGALCDAIESVTEGYRGANFSHVAMVTSVGEDEVKILEAIGGKVQQTRLSEFLTRSQDAAGNPKVMVGRIRDNSIALQGIEEVKKYMDKKYDDVFDIDNDRYYCSELLYFSYKHKEKPIFKLFPMTFKNPMTGDFDPAWIDYYKQLGQPIPEGEPGLNPGGISRSPWVDIVYKFGNPSGYISSTDVYFDEK